MGKQRGERSKSRPSSSSLAASLVSGGNAPPAGFGFGGFVGSARVAEATKGADEEISADIDGEIASHLRRLSKRDSTTKLKALAALGPMFHERPPSELVAVLPSWVFIYRRLAADSSRQVREQAHLAMKELASRVGRSLAPHLRVLMGPWWVSQFDPSREVAEAARASFLAAFPAQKKQVEALAFCQGEMFEYLDETLGVTPQTVDKSVAPEEAADWVERQLSAGLLAMATLLQVLGGQAGGGGDVREETTRGGKEEANGKQQTTSEEEAHENESGQKDADASKGGGIDPGEGSSGAAKVVELAGGVAARHRFFAPCLKHASPVVRGAAYQTLRALCESARAQIRENLSAVAPLILGSLTEREPAVHRAMWDMLLSFVRFFSGGWEFVNVRKAVLPGLWGLLRHACYGSAEVSYPCLLVLVSLLPHGVVGTGPEFWGELFGALWGGREACVAEVEWQALLRAWRECLVYVLTNAEKYAEPGREGTLAFRHEIVRTVLLDTAWDEYMQSGGGSRAGAATPTKSAEVSRDQDADRVSSHARAGPSGQAAAGGVADERNGREATAGSMGRGSLRMLDLAEAMGEAVIQMEKIDDALSEFWADLTKRILATLSESGGGDPNAVVKRVGDFYMVVSRLAKRPPVLGKKGPALAMGQRKSNALDAGVKPLVAGVWELAVGSSDAVPLVRLLTRLVTLYGTESLGGIADKGETAKSQFEAVRFLVTTRLIPWCLGGRGEERSTVEGGTRLEFLLAILKDERLRAEWEGVLGRLTRWAVKAGGSEEDTVAKHLEDVETLGAVLGKLREQGAARRLNLESAGVDAAALVVGSSSSLEEAPCQEFLKQAMGAGGGRVPFVSGAALRGVLERLLQRMDEGRQGGKGADLALAAVDIGGAYALSKKVPEEVEEVRGKILATLFSLSWLGGKAAGGVEIGEGATDGATESGIETQVTQTGGKETGSLEGSVERLAAAARLLAGALTQDVVVQLGAEQRAAVQHLLVEEIRRQVAEGEPATCVQVAERAAEVVQRLAVGREERGAVIDLSVAPMGSWPRWSRAMLPAGGKNRRGSEEGVKVERAFAAFVGALVQRIGLEEVFLAGTETDSEKGEEGGEKNRAWLAIELVVAHEAEGAENPGAVMRFLVECGRSATDREFALLHHVIDGLVKAAVADVSGEQDTVSAENALRALCRLLGELVGGAAWGGDEVLPIVMPHLREQRPGDSEGAVNKTVGIWLKQALEALPLTAPEEGPKGEAALEKVLLAVSCFPLHAEGGEEAVKNAARAAPPEKQADTLLELLRRQFHSREAMAAVAREAAAKRLGAVDPGDPDDIDGQDASGDEWADRVEAALAQLMMAAIAYGWAHFGEVEWGDVLGRVEKWLEKMVSSQEEHAETLSEAIAEAVQTEGETSVRQTAVFEEVRDCLHSADDDLSGLPLLSVKTLELLLALPLPGSSAKAVDIGAVGGIDGDEWLRMRHVALVGALRMVCIAGLEEAAAREAGGDRTAELVVGAREKQGAFWGSVARVSSYATVGAITEAATSMDTWAEVGVGRGAVPSLQALLFSPRPSPPLQRAAHSLLSRTPLLDVAVSTAKDEDASAEDEALVSAEHPAVVAGIRPEMAAILETRAGDLLLAAPLAPLRARYLLAWSLLLARLRSLPATAPAYEKLVQYVQETGAALNLLEVLFQYIPLDLTPPKAKAAPKRAASLETPASEWFPVTKASLPGMAAALYMDVLRVLPACARLWFMDLRERSVAAAVEAYTSGACSSALLEAEFRAVQESVGTQDNLSIRANRAAREVIAAYSMDESSLEMVIRLPAAYPLRPVEVECTKRIGVSESRLRKWLLSISAFLRHQNGAVSAAVLLWKQNVEREFEGVEECPICYSVIHTTNHALPRLPCKTCKHKFHAACLYKWFASSHKSTCPLCQTPF
ncbi:Zinc finger RING-type domain containing protein [Klebsormidium nitens]|uniref:E3 ubiquitin-protein ligase listerin n=1 Tax=Klebsormidium nitens TaxID=105231 RepID=A0A1Y1IWW1_KLENI|nr:Zinc finger RING-type domain containing protein [Klebsormidium nitens]|eukprot:GAQ92748.1 Zinc finger RING-type domain containing protein [Klebsormidium nitens]